jgi:hypothetical protein
MVEKKDVHVAPDNESSTIKKESAKRATKLVETKKSSKAKSQLWREWASGHQKGTTVLSDEAISREIIYGDRG